MEGSDIKNSEFVTPFNKKELCLVLGYIYNGNIENGSITEMETLNIISVLSKMDFFNLLVDNLWFDLFNCMKGIIDTKIFTEIINKKEIFIRLLKDKDFVDNLLRLSRDTLRCISNTFIGIIVAIATCDKFHTVHISKIASLVMRWCCANSEREDTKVLLEEIDKKVPNILSNVSYEDIDQNIKLLNIGLVFERIIELKKKQITDQYKKPTYLIARDVVDSLYSTSYD